MPKVKLLSKKSMRMFINKKKLTKVNYQLPEKYNGKGKMTPNTK